jgi:predicted AAA+ superfamily ATPase
MAAPRLTLDEIQAHAPRRRVARRPRDAWPEAVVGDKDVAPSDWQALARQGGYPTPALHTTTDTDRASWFEGYRRTYVERDLRQLSAITDLVDFDRVMRGATVRIGNILDQTELARDVGISRPTVHRYLNLLETSYQLVRTPAYAANRTKRLIKSHPPARDLVLADHRGRRSGLRHRMASEVVGDRGEGR